MTAAGRTTRYLKSPGPLRSGLFLRMRPLVRPTERPTYTVTFSAEGAQREVEDTGDYLALLERQDDSRWRITYLILNSDRPPGGDNGAR